MAVLGSVVGALGSIVSGVFSFAQASYQAKVAEMNEEIAKDNAKRAIQRSQVNEQTQSDQALALLGEQEAAMSASGLGINSPSLRRVRRSSAMLARKDILNIRQDAEIEKYNYLTDAANYKAQGQMAMIGGVGSLLGGFLNATGSFVGRSSSTASPFAPRPYAKPTSMVF